MDLYEAALNLLNVSTLGYSIILLYIILASAGTVCSAFSSLWSGGVFWFFVHFARS